MGVMSGIPITLAAGGGGNWAVYLLAVLAAAALVTLVLNKVKLAAIPAYLIAGVLIGPSVLGIVTDSGSIDAIGDLAIVLLLFTIGLHMDLGSMRGGMLPILGVGFLSTAATTAIAWPAAMLFGLGAPEALVVAMAVAMSSTAVVLGLVQSNRELHRVFGRLCLGVLIVQDLLAIVALASLPMIAAWAGIDPVGGAIQSSGADAVPVGESVGVGEAGGAGGAGGVGGVGGAIGMLADTLFTIGVMGLVITAGVLLIPKVLREADRAHAEELLLLVSAAIGLGAAVITTAFGLGPALGAFVAGFLLASTPFKHQLSGQLAPIRDLFMAVFFTTVGLKVDLGTAMEMWWVIALGLAGVTLIKLVTIGGSCWLLGATPSLSIRASITMAHPGEFTLVVLLAATSGFAGLVTSETSAVVTSVVFLALVFTPSVYEPAKSISTRVRGFRPSPLLRVSALGRQDEVDEQAPPHAIIAGFGVVGRSVAEALDRAQIPYIVVELNAETVRRQQSIGRRAVYGDISSPEVLRSAQIKAANAVLLTIPDDDATLRATRAIREQNREVFIGARTSFLSRAMTATQLGADEVIVEEIATAEKMSECVIKRFTPPSAGSS